MRERIKALETHVGEQPKSGLRGDVLLLFEKFDTIMERMRSSEIRIGMITGGGIVGVWMIEHFHLFG